MGDRVERDEPLFEVSTDKVDSEMPSPASGVLREILAGEGDTVATGARVAVIDESAAASAPRRAAGARGPGRDGPGARAPSALPGAHGGLRGGGVPGRATHPRRRRARPRGGARARGPAARSRGATPSAPRAPVPPTRSRWRCRPGGAGWASTWPPPSRVVPHGFVALEADASVLDEPRRRRRGDARRRRSSPPRSWSRSPRSARLGEFELLNATFEDDSLVIHHSVNVGFVRTTGDGMLVPVVHAAGGLTLRSLARRVSDLDERTGHPPPDRRRPDGRDLHRRRAAGRVHALGPADRRRSPRSPSSRSARRGASRSSTRRARSPSGGASCSASPSTTGSVAPSTAAAYLERVAQLLAGLDVGSER